MATTDITDAPRIITAVIQPTDPHAPLVKRPPSSKTIARLKAKADEKARNAAAAQALARQVQRGFKPPAGKLFGVDMAALLLIGPRGALGTTSRVAATLTPLAAGGRHPAAVLMEAGGWQDEAALREALAALAPKLSALGVRVCRRKAGLRMARAR